MLYRVSQRLLHHPVRNQVQGRGQWPGFALHAHVNGQSGGTRTLSKPFELRESRRCRTEHVDVVAVQHPDHLAQIGQRFPAASFHRPKRVRGRAPVSARYRAGGHGLDHHHAHAVGDNVVQLPCDPDPFGRRHAPHPFTLLFGEALGVDLKRGSQCDTATDDTSGGKWDSKEKRPHGERRPR